MNKKKKKEREEKKIFGAHSAHQGMQKLWSKREAERCHTFKVTNYIIATNYTAVGKDFHRKGMELASCKKYSAAEISSIRLEINSTKREG